MNNVHGIGHMVQNVTKVQPCFPTSQPADYAPDALNDNSIIESQRDN